MQNGGKVKILLVDDQPSNLLALEALLAAPDRILVTARSGEEALLRVLDDDFAVILMDVQMPGMNGLETAALIRERDRSRGTPIIFLTAFQSDEAQVFQGYSLGAVDFLSKPIVPAVLRSKVSVLVDLFEKTEQVRRQAELLVENQRREHEHELAEQRRHWEMEHLRAEAAREKKVAEEVSLRAEELARNVADRMRAEEKLRERARQQEAVAELGQRGLEGAPPAKLLDEAISLVVQTLGVDFGRIMELLPDSRQLHFRAGYGWQRDLVEYTEPADAESGSLSAYALACNEPAIVEDFAAEARFAASALLRDHGVASGASVVIRERERLYGALSVFGRQPRAFTRDDIHFLQSVANILATAIQRKRGEDELAGVRDELAAQLSDMKRLHALGTRLSTSIELQAVLEEVIAAVASLQGADRGVLMLHDRESGTMTVGASIGLDEGAVEAGQAGVEGNGSITAVISGGIIVEDLKADPVFAPLLPAALRSGARAVCSTPLLTGGGELVGAIATYFDFLHRPSDRETRLVELYARQAAEFIDNARLYRAIRDSDRRKGEFLAMLSHELRNPLAPILNALHFLSLAEVDPAEADQAREVAERQVRHLARLVDDLLDVSRISSGKIHLRKGRMVLASAVESAVETSRPLLASRDHELTVSLPDEPIVMEADEARVAQILANLLNNAAKYTEPGGRVTLSGERQGDAVVLRVCDTGIGIAPDVLPQVFDLFRQEDRSIDRSQGGLGIGLTLVKNLVELHGGTVEATSEGRGNGSTFTVRLPVGDPGRFEAPEAVGGAGRLDESEESPPRRVMVVDDNIDGARMLARLLIGWGHEVRVFHEGRSALEEAPAFQPDVILLDIGLPGMDGCEVARRLKEHAALSQASVIALTGYGQGEDRRRTQEAGFDHHLVKPVDPRMLRRLLAHQQPIAQ